MFAIFIGVCVYSQTCSFHQIYINSGVICCQKYE